MRPLVKDRDTPVRKKRPWKEISWKQIAISTVTYATISTAAYFLIKEFRIPKEMVSLGASVILLVLVTGGTVYKYNSLSFSQKVLFIGLIVSFSILTILLFIGMRLSVLHIAVLLLLPVLLFKVLERRQTKADKMDDTR